MQRRKPTWPGRGFRPLRDPNLSAPAVPGVPYKPMDNTKAEVPTSAMVRALRSTVEQVKAFKRHADSMLTRPDYYDGQQLVDFFKSIEQCQILFPMDEEIEINRTIWIDLMRWSLIARITGGRKWRPNLLPIIALVTEPSLNPWCNLAMATSHDCSQCLLVKAKAVKVPKAMKNIDRLYLYCRRNPSVMKVAEVICKKVNGAYTNDVKAFKEALEELNKLAKKQLERGEALQVWEFVTFGQEGEK